MVLMGFSFVMVFLLIASGGMLLFYRDTMLQRISSAVTPKDRRGLLAGAAQRPGVSIAHVLDPFERVLPKSQAEVSVVQQRLIRAGYRNEHAIKTFYSCKVLVPLALCGLGFLSGLADGNAFFVYATALAVGYLLPDFWLGRKIKSRQKRIRLGLPDVLDLMVVCMEAGLSMDMATARAAQELRLAQPALSDELGMVVLEQRAGRARGESWKQFANRTQVDNVRTLVSVIVQAEQLGTSIAKTLRVHADTMRTHRKQVVEEQAAKTTVKLVFPLVLCIFPSLFLVTLGPAVIIMTESFHKYLTP